jgi:nucleotide-binding universal stress UspA family protein
MRVLAAVDLGAQSDLVLRIAARRAREGGGELGVCHVIPDLRAIHPLFPQAELGTVGVVSEVALRAREAMERTVAASVPDAGAITYFCEQGEAYPEIVRRAEAWGADLVVVAARGSRGLLADWLGGVADRVVRYAHCPVLVARNLREAGHVVVATDLSDPSLPAIEAGLAESRLRGGGLTVLHVIPQMPSVSDGPHGVMMTTIAPQALVATEAATKAAYEERLKSEIRKQLGIEDPAVSVRVVAGPAAATIVSVAQSLEAELVVVGTRGRTGLSRVVLGSVAEEVVRTAASSVMVIRLR